MLGVVFLKWWTWMETPRSESFAKGKQPRNSFPNVLSMSWHFATLNPLSSFLTINFFKIFCFFSPSVFSFFFFFVKQGPLDPSKFVSAWSKPLWDSFCDSSYSIFKSSMNSFHLTMTSCNVLSFMFFTKKPFSSDIGVSSLMIMFIEQLANCFFHGSSSMTTTMSKSWTHTFKS